jgi:hypothetical protein
MQDRPTRQPEKSRKYSLIDHFDHIYNKRGDVKVRKDFLVHLGAIAISTISLIVSILVLCYQLTKN